MMIKLLKKKERDIEVELNINTNINVDVNADARVNSINRKIENIKLRRENLEQKFVVVDETKKFVLKSLIALID